MLWSSALGADTVISHDAVGVVVLHGKWGSPSDWTLRLAQALEKKGYQVASPEMPWSGHRLYDGGVASAMSEIDAVIMTLRSHGAKKIFVAGHSLGAAATVRYGSRSGVDGLILLSPGHFPESTNFAHQLGAAVTRARQMVQTGKGDDRADFEDLNTGHRQRLVRTTARIYLDYFDSEGPMNFTRNLAALSEKLPILWVVGNTEEPGLRAFGDRRREHALTAPGSQFAEVVADHLRTPEQAIPVVLAWLQERTH